MCDESYTLCRSNLVQPASDEARCLQDNQAAVHTCMNDTLLACSTALKDLRTGCKSILGVPSFGVPVPEWEARRKVLLCSDGILKEDTGLSICRCAAHWKAA